LFSSKDQTLLIGRDSFFILDFWFDIVNGVRRLNLEGNGFTRQSLDENLHYHISIMDLTAIGGEEQMEQDGWRLTFDVLTMELGEIGGLLFFILNLG
jgi:hypothetical protein